MPSFQRAQDVRVVILAVQMRFAGDHRIDQDHAVEKGRDFCRCQRGGGPAHGVSEGYDGSVAEPMPAPELLLLLWEPRQLRRMRTRGCGVGQVRDEEVQNVARVLGPVNADRYPATQQR